MIICANKVSIYNSGSRENAAQPDFQTSEVVRGLEGERGREEAANDLGRLRIKLDTTELKPRSINQTHKPSATEPLTTTPDTTLVTLVKNELTKSKNPSKVTRFLKFKNL